MAPSLTRDTTPRPEALQNKVQAVSGGTYGRKGGTARFGGRILFRSVRVSNPEAHRRNLEAVECPRGSERHRRGLWEEIWAL